MFHTLRRVMLSMSGCLLLAASMAQVSLAMGTAFTYQGQLKGTDGVPLTTTCELTFALYDALSGGAQVGATVTQTGVAVTNGLFTTSVDFGSDVFDGRDRWLQITAQCGSDTAATTLSPRQALTPTPYALYAAGGVFENVSGVVRSTGTHATDDFVFGSPQLADVTTGTDDDARVFFDKSKGAFRAGYVDGTQWDDASVGNYSFAAGYNNTASNYAAIVAGGYRNTASGQVTAVGGGYNNQATSNYAAVAGGYNNAASNDFATVAGGYNNAASGQDATVAGGNSNTASNDFATVAGGNNNTASGQYATVSGGHANTAAGDWSFAAGRRAKIDAAHDGAFLFADGTNTDFASAAANEFAVRATGGVRFVQEVGVSGTPANTVTIPNQNGQAVVEPADGCESGQVLTSDGAGVWTCAYLSGSLAMADYTAQFTTVDASIQELHQKLQERDATIAALRTRVATLEQQQAQQVAQQATIDLLLQRLTALEQAMHAPVAQADVQH